MKPDTWGDAATINALSLYWGAKIIIVRAAGHRITETRLHCNDDLPLADADFVVLYNGTSHYSACCK